MAPLAPLIAGEIVVPSLNSSDCAAESNYILFDIFYRCFVVGLSVYQALFVDSMKYIPWYDLPMGLHPLAHEAGLEWTIR